MILISLTFIPLYHGGWQSRCEKMVVDLRSYLEIALKQQTLRSELRSVSKKHLKNNSDIVDHFDPARLHHSFVSPWLVKVGVKKCWSIFVYLYLGMPT